METKLKLLASGFAFGDCIWELFWAVATKIETTAQS